MQIRINSKFPILATGLAVVVGVPVPTHASPEPGFSVKNNVQAQVVDMDPKYVGDLVEGGVGQRSAAAVNRYMSDNIRPLIRSDLRSAVGGQGGAQKSGDVSGTGEK
jgi:hypothetical protein